jgi:hypothetical protein
VSCPCSRRENRRMLSTYEMSTHLAKKGFMSNYLFVALTRGGAACGS